jgi:hypothetical protein
MEDLRSLLRGGEMLESETKKAILLMHGCQAGPTLGTSGAKCSISRIGIWNVVVNL